MDYNDYQKHLLHEKISLTEKEIILEAINDLKLLTVGNDNFYFANTFLSEMLNLLLNSIDLYEKGYFECAFYSIRQASEIGYNMVYLATNKQEISKWDSKKRFPFKKSVLLNIERFNAFYSEISSITLVKNIFEDQKKLFDQYNKIIHKQGFDTFYDYRSFTLYDKTREKEDFLLLLKYTLTQIMLLSITTDPMILVLADEELDRRINFNPMTSNINSNFFRQYLSEQMIEGIKSTDYFTSIKQFLLAKERMNDYTYNVIRNQYYDCKNLYKIQKHLLNTDEQIMYEILSKEIEISTFYPDSSCIIFYYFTSYTSKTKNSLPFRHNLIVNNIKSESINLAFGKIYRSCFESPNRIWIFEHNEKLTNEQIIDIKNILTNNLSSEE